MATQSNVWADGRDNPSREFLIALGGLSPRPNQAFSKPWNIHRVKSDSRYRSSPKMILFFSCVVSRLCQSGTRFHYINPTTQLSLYSLCHNECPSASSVIWTIHEEPWNSSIAYEPSWFFGRWRALLVKRDACFMFEGLTEKNLTISNALFDAYDRVKHWRFQVTYSFEFQTIEQTFDVQINDRSSNGSCSIQPPSGDLLTLFTMRCLYWHDNDRIQDYLIYGLSVPSTHEGRLSLV